MRIEFGPQVLISLVITLAGVALGGLIGYLSASRIAHLNARLAAGAKLRCAFATELASMRLAQTDEFGVVDGLLGEAFPRHAAAIEEYRFFVRSKDQAAYQQAWEEYYTNGETTGEACGLRTTTRATSRKSFLSNGYKRSSDLHSANHYQDYGTEPPS